MRWVMAAVVLISSGTVLAQDVSGAYMGATVGNLTYTEQADGLISSSDFDDSASAYRLYGGYRLGKRLALELGYATSDGVSDTIDMDLLGSLVPVEVSNDFTLTTARALLHFPISAERLPFVSLSAFAGLGVYDADIESTGTIAGLPFVATETTDDGSTALLGLQVDFPRVSVRGEYEWFDTESSVDIWSAGVGLIFRF
jgi:hypothetical protein